MNPEQPELGGLIEFHDRLRLNLPPQTPEDVRRAAESINRHRLSTFSAESLAWLAFTTSGGLKAQSPPKGFESLKGRHVPFKPSLYNSGAPDSSSIRKHKVGRLNGEVGKINLKAMSEADLDTS